MQTGDLHAPGSEATAEGGKAARFEMPASMPNNLAMSAFMPGSYEKLGCRALAQI